MKEKKEKKQWKRHKDEGKYFTPDIARWIFIVMTDYGHSKLRIHETTCILLTICTCIYNLYSVLTVLTWQRCDIEQGKISTTVYSTVHQNKQWNLS